MIKDEIYRLGGSKIFSKLFLTPKFYPKDVLLILNGFKFRKDILGARKNFCFKMKAFVTVLQHPQCLDETDSFKSIFQKLQ